ncbi:MAG TPA: hypothetical protein VEF76_01075 [Patescibacteria group bacterium]|nr:hypothetical protein [Patescibacteria group bacterium]
MSDNIQLPGGYCLFVNLALVEVLEQDTTIIKMAERLVARDMKLAEMIAVLRRCYAHAGCTRPVAEMDEFLIGRSPALLLAEILCAVLAPASAMGAITPGELQGA